MYQPHFTEFEKLAKKGNLIPVYREILADVETPVSVLTKLQKRITSIFWKASRAARSGDGIRFWVRMPVLCLEFTATT